MQSDLEFEVSTISSRSLYSAQGVLVKSETPSSSLTDLISVQPGLRGRKRPSSAVWGLILMLGDVALFIVLFGLLLFFHLIPRLPASELEIREVKLIWICLALVSWSLAVNMTQSQNLSYASNRFKGPCCTLFALVLMCIFWMLLSYFLLDFRFITLVRFDLFFLGLAIPVFTIWRFLFAEVRGLPRFRLRAVIVGINSAGETVAEELQAAKHSSTNILGYIDENIEEKPYNGLPVLGGRIALRYLVYNNMIDMVIIALKYGTNLDLLKEATDAAQHGISVLPMAVVFENSTGKIPVEHVGDQWYVALQSERILSPFYLCGKKALDLVCGIVGLLVLCLMLPIIALCTYLDSPGPIFYSQERVGLRGKLFRIYKFRTMRTDAEAGGHAVWAAASDKRITRVGRFLRSTHLDEVPQVFNILRGDMSLIGPRPEASRIYQGAGKSNSFLWLSSGR